MTWPRHLGWTVAALAALGLALAVVVGGCEVETQDSPRDVSADVRPEYRAKRAGYRVSTFEVFFVREGRLQPVQRTSWITSGLSGALGQLTDANSRWERRPKVRTALPRTGRTIAGTVLVDGVAWIPAPPELKPLTYDRQRLAYAQIVFTATAVPGVVAVRLVRDGVPIDVPTDYGMVRDRAVVRGDFLSVQPPLKRAKDEDRKNGKGGKGGKKDDDRKDRKDRKDEKRDRKRS